MKKLIALSLLSSCAWIGLDPAIEREIVEDAEKIAEEIIDAPLKKGFFALSKDARKDKMSRLQNYRSKR